MALAYRPMRAIHLAASIVQQPPTRIRHARIDPDPAHSTVTWAQAAPESSARSPLPRPSRPHDETAPFAARWSMMRFASAASIPGSSSSSPCPALLTLMYLRRGAAGTWRFGGAGTGVWTGCTATDTAGATGGCEIGVVLVATSAGLCRRTRAGAPRFTPARMAHPIAPVEASCQPRSPPPTSGAPAVHDECGRFPA